MKSDYIYIWISFLIGFYIIFIMEETIILKILYLFFYGAIIMILFPFIRKYFGLKWDEKKRIKDESIVEVVKILKELNKASIETVGFSIQILKKEEDISTEYNEPEKIGYALESLKKPYHLFIKNWKCLNNSKKDVNIKYQSLKKTILTKIPTKTENDRKKITGAMEYLVEIILEEPIDDINPDKLTRTKHIGKIQIRYNDKVVDDFHPDIFEKYKIEKLLSKIITDAEIQKELKTIKEKKDGIDEFFKNFKDNFGALLSLSESKIKKKIKLKKSF